MIKYKSTNSFVKTNGLIKPDSKFMKTFIVEIISELMRDNYFSKYKFRKRDMRIYIQTRYGKQYVDFDYWMNPYSIESSLVVYPQYMVRFEVLEKWFEKFSVKPLQVQRDSYTSGFSGNMIGEHDEFIFLCDRSNYSEQLKKLVNTVKRCSEYSFSKFNSLKDLYEYWITPVLERKKSLPATGAEWVFEYLTLCKIINPQRYQQFKNMVRTHVGEMNARKEPNIIEYYDNFDKIISYMENLNLKDPDDL